VFDSFGIETPIAYSKEELDTILNNLCGDSYGIILRAKGIVKATDNEKWYYFDFVSGDYEIRLGEPDIIGKLCVIGSGLNKTKLQDLLNKRG
jgi:G3E family GTPase